MPACWPSACASPFTRPEEPFGTPWQGLFGLLQAGLTTALPLALPSRDRRTAPAAHRRAGRNGGGGPAPVPEIGPARRSRRGNPDHSQAGQPGLSLAAATPSGGSVVTAVSGDAERISLSSERRELLCSVIGLAVKLGLVAVAGVSLLRLAGAYQQRMERQGEISAVLELQSSRLTKARTRFDQLFITEGEQRLIREQSQWIAPNRMRVVWQNNSAAAGVETASVPQGSEQPARAAGRP